MSEIYTIYFPVISICSHFNVRNQDYVFQIIVYEYIVNVFTVIASIYTYMILNLMVSAHGPNGK